MIKEDSSDRRTNDPWRTEVRAQIAQLNHRMDENTAVTHANNLLIHEVKRSTDEIVEFFEAGKGFFAVVRAVGGVARWIAIIAAAAGIAYGIVKFGVGQIIADIRGK